MRPEITHFGEGKEPNDVASACKFAHPKQEYRRARPSCSGAMRLYAIAEIARRVRQWAQWVSARCVIVVVVGDSFLAHKYSADFSTPPVISDSSENDSLPESYGVYGIIF